MSALDPDSIWRGVFDERLFSLFPRLSNTLGGHSSAKDRYLSEVAQCLFTTNYYKFPILREGTSKEELIANMLFGTCTYEGVSKSALFIERVMAGFTWLIPRRYSREVTIVEPLEMIEMFLEKFTWYPKRLYLTDYDTIDEYFKIGNSCVFQLFLSRVETIEVYNDDYRDGMYGDMLKPLWLALVSTSSPSFKNVTLSACVTNLGAIVSTMAETLFNDEQNLDYSDSEDSDCGDNILPKYSGLKRIEILGNNAGTHPHEYGYGAFFYHDMHGLIPFLDWQNGLEYLVVEGLENIVETNDYGDWESCYDGFETFYNYLPYIISKPSLKLLHLTNCRVPVNTVESMLSTFLGRPTDHHQSLKFEDCEITKKSNDTYSDFYPLMSSTSIPCVCGEYKSLSIRVDTLPFSLRWLFEYPKLRLKQLELRYKCGPMDLEVLEACPGPASIDTICCKISLRRFKDGEKERKKIGRLLAIRSLSEIKFLNFPRRAGDLLFHVLADAFSHPLQLASLTRLQLEKGAGDKFRAIFNVVFSMPTEQLANFTLEVIDMQTLNQEDLIEAWRANGRGQKLRKVLVRPCDIEPLHEMAVTVDS